MRLDKALLERYPHFTRTKAQTLIQEGNVKVNNTIITKNNYEIQVNDTIDVNYNVDAYVSRGGDKLAHAITTFQLDFKDLVVVDIGSSTGGFTDCALKHGAKKVYAIDVGTNQLDASLRHDSRVVVMEETHFNDVTHLNDSIDAFMMDVSFISVTKLFHKINDFMEPNAFLVVLIKPQFEAGSVNINKAGIVKDRNIHAKVLDTVNLEANHYGLFLNQITHSKIQGKSGNIEYVALFTKTSSHKTFSFRHIVSEAFEAFKG